jgi:hypothetical protein
MENDFLFSKADSQSSLCPHYVNTFLCRFSWKERKRDFLVYCVNTQTHYADFAADISAVDMETDFIFSVVFTYILFSTASPKLVITYQTIMYSVLFVNIYMFMKTEESQLSHRVVTLRSTMNILGWI